MDNELQTAISRLKDGIAPGHSALISDITVGIDFLTDFWTQNYLNEYISKGGNRIQFIMGRQGSGKTHLIEYFLSRAENYKVVSFSAREIWVHDFKEIFFEVLRQCDIEECLQRCSSIIVKELAFSPEEYNGRFVDYLASKGLGDPITKREIRLQLNRLFMSNPLMDVNFAYTCALLTGGLLGHPLLEEPAREALLGWMNGSKEVKLSTLRNLGLAPVRITKNNARHMLRSLVEVIKMAGYNGLVIAVDDLEMLVSRDNTESIRYTRLKREDAYESIREIIDEIDTLCNIFFLFAFDRKLIDDDINGIKSYQALWLRIQNEIKSDRVNRFSNLIDLDRIPMYDVRTVMDMSARIAELLNSAGDRPAQSLNEEAARELLLKSDFSEQALPRLVVMATLGKWEAN